MGGVDRNLAHPRLSSGPDSDSNTGLRGKPRAGEWGAGVPVPAYLPLSPVDTEMGAPLTRPQADQVSEESLVPQEVTSWGRKLPKEWVERHDLQGTRPVLPRMAGVWPASAWYVLRTQCQAGLEPKEATGATEGRVLP